MFRSLNLLFVTLLIFSLGIVPGVAFQLFGGQSTGQQSGDIGLPYPIENNLENPKNTPLDLGESGKSAEDEGLNIWIPGLGVVGKMPKLDFGLEMLYGAPETSTDEPRTARELEEFESDFAIKGTIKRKF